MDAIEPKRTSLGRLSLYVTALERGPAPHGRLFAWRPSLYRHVLTQAKRDGIRHAISYHITECALEDGPICLDRSEYSDPRHVICIELVDEPEALEAFCMRQRAVLGGRTLLFLPIERWTVPASNAAMPDEQMLQHGAIGDRPEY